MTMRPDKQGTESRSNIAHHESLGRYESANDLETCSRQSLHLNPYKSSNMFLSTTLLCEYHLLELLFHIPLRLI